MEARSLAANSATTPLVPLNLKRREPTENDVVIHVLFCGICHSDIHHVRNEWSSLGNSVYPLVPGHEIVGRVSKLGSQAAKKFTVGDLVAVGCLVDSDRTCDECKDGFEQYCAKQVLTYGGKDKHLGGVTQGGYSSLIVVDEHFVLRVPANLDLAGTAPLLCAGITTYSPMRRWGVKAGDKVGIVGLGGLGHMGVKLARAMGATVVVFTTTRGKAEDALRLGAHEVVVSTEANEMKKYANSLDFILNTVSGKHDINAYLKLLRRDGNMTLVGAPPDPLQVAAFALILKRRNLSGSLIGGIAETQEMLDFCGKHNITADVEIIPASKVNEAYERLLNSQVKYRFVIDISTLEKA